MAELTVLHTSDWHLGHQLYRKKRDQEFAAFLDWLSHTLSENRVDVLLLSGDIFDSGNPGMAAQSMYYHFLGKISTLGVRHVVITGGNHDSPAFLNASSPVLKSLNIHVIASCPANPEDEILLLRDKAGQPECIVCAAPFLREGDLCQFMPGQDHAEREKRLQEGLKEHFANLADLAEKMRQECGSEIPVIATAHLFTAGINLEEEKSSREIYRGNLGCVPLAYFPETFDYVALGHIHRPCAVNGNPTRRYSGSPLPMTFAERLYDKEVALLRWQGRQVEVQPIAVPAFKNMLTIAGSASHIQASLRQLATGQGAENIWLEIQHDGSDSAAGLADMCQEAVNGTQLEILCVKSQSASRQPDAWELDQGLDELEPLEMFKRCLDFENIPEEEHAELLANFHELLLLTQEEQDL